MATSDFDFVNAIAKELTKTKEKAPIRYKKIKKEVEVTFEPEPDIKLAVDNTKIQYKKGLI